jgi:hypothetical protein
MVLDTIRTRVTSILAASPYSLTRSANPIDFDRDPLTIIDGLFHIGAEAGHVSGGSNYSETHVDLLHVEVARLQQGDPEVCYQKLLTDCASISAAVIRDGVVGDYDVPDEGRGFTLNHEPGRAFSVLRLTLPVDYEAQA